MGWQRTARLKEPQMPSPIQPPPFCEVRPRCASLAPLMRRCARGRRPKGRTSIAQSPSLILSSHSVDFSLSPTPPSGFAAGRRGRRFGEPRYSLSDQIPAQSSARHGSKTDYGFEPEEQSQPKAQSSSPPRVGLTAAPLSLRRVFARPGKSCQNMPTHFDDFPPKARRAAVLREGTALGPGRPHVPWTGNARAFPLAASTPVL